MAQRLLSQKSKSQRVEIEERDQANNLVATYIKSEKGDENESSRIDVVVSLSVSVRVAVQY